MYGHMANFARFNVAPRRRLSGLGANPFIIVMPNGDQHTYSAIVPSIATDLNNGGRPLRPDNVTYYNVSMFEGGYLFDNCPLNVILGNGWIAGQQQALYAAGITPDCPQVGPIGVQAMNPPAPLTTSPVVPVGAASTTTINAPAGSSYVNPITTSGIVTAASPAAPQTTVSSSTGSAPSSPTIVTEAPAGLLNNTVTPEVPGTTDNTMTYLAIGVIAVILLMKGGSNG